MHALKGLSDIPVAQRLHILPVFFKQVVELAQAMVEPQRIVLFGSHARGDAVSGSDYDIAFSGLRCPGQWSRFTLDLMVTAQTLEPYDLVLYDDADLGLKASIDREGVVIYERTAD